MRASSYPLATLRDIPADAEVISHQLMLRAGMIRKLASGLYSWLPTGLRVLRRVEQIIRDEMDRSGALELLMPVTQPAELWDESGRYIHYGPELLRFADRHQRPFVLGPTHEEVITDLVRREIRSYRQLPLNFYQIQTKFRDEVRPRFGVMRSREFIMKDAYSFHLNQDSLQQTYDTMYATYQRIFGRLGLDFRAVLADTGSIGGQGSHEFHVLANSGEDVIAFSDQSNYAANIEMAEALPPQQPRAQAQQDCHEVHTGKAHSIEDVCTQLQCTADRVLKTLIVRGKPDSEGKPTWVALILRGDHTLNEIKAAKLPDVAAPLTLASEAEVMQAVGCGVGTLGPVGLNLPIWVDHAAAHAVDFICGANRAEFHFCGVNWEKDVPAGRCTDLRDVVEGDPSPDGHGKLMLKRGIEVGHIFQLGQKYSAALGAEVLGEDGRPLTLTMGCYGIGVTRVVAAAIEQNHDEQGIIWPESLAPFQIVLIPMNWNKSPRIQRAAIELYERLRTAGYDVLLDDRNERPGVKFADAELLGIPHRLVLGEKGLDEGQIEYKNRRDGTETIWSIDTLEQSLGTQVGCQPRR